VEVLFAPRRTCILGYSRIANIIITVSDVGRKVTCRVSAKEVVARALLPIFSLWLPHATILVVIREHLDEAEGHCANKRVAKKHELADALENFASL